MTSVSTMHLFSLSTKELVALSINVADAPLWVRMLLVFREAATSQSGL